MRPLRLLSFCCALFGVAATNTARADEPKTLDPSPTPAPTIAIPPPITIPPTPPPAWQFAVGPDDGISVRRTDGMFSFKAGILVQAFYRARWVDAKFDDQLFNVSMVRPTINVSILRRWITLFVQPELANTQRLLDLELTVHPIDEIGIKVGQFVTPFSRSFMVPVPKILMPTFSLAVTTFRGDRDTGAMFFGMLAKGRFEYYLGAFNGNGIGKGANDNHEFSYYFRFAGTLFGQPPSTASHVHYDETPALAGSQRPGLQLGAAAYWNRLTTPATMTAPAVSHRNWTAGGDLQFHVWYFVLQAEGFYRHDEQEGGPTVQSAGGYAHASVFVIPKWLELAFRATYMVPNTAQASTHLTNYEAQAASYPLGNHLKVIASYTATDTVGSSAALYGYAKGLTHTAVVFTQLWF